MKGDPFIRRTVTEGVFDMPTEAQSSIDPALVTAVLDRLIPASDTMPGAGGIATQYVTGVTTSTLASAPALVAAFTEIARRSQVDNGCGFDQLSTDRQEMLLREVERTHPSAFDALILHCYSGYYSNPAVLRALGRDPRPPQPLGNPLPLTDWSILEPVRQRGKLWRDA